MSAFLSVVCGSVVLFFALSAARVESARHTWHAPQTMFVFGDSFVDNGNLPRTDVHRLMTRQWYYPYGISYQKDVGSGRRPNATGRFSDFMVQSDFVAKMIGLPESPPAYQSRNDIDYEPSGLNFALGGTGIYQSGFDLMTVGEQVKVFESLINRRTLSKNLVTHSVALLAVSGHDYDRFLGTSSFQDINAFIGNVTTEIAAAVERIRDLGVKRVLVNNLHPLGCTPSHSRGSLYDVCNEVGNGAAANHNRNLEKKLGRKKGVFIVDLYTAFRNIINHIDHDQGLEPLNKFINRRRPCCESFDPQGYCGQLGENRKPLYHVCLNPSMFFFWDDVHPTHAGWESVMRQLEQPIKKFLGVL